MINKKDISKLESLLYLYAFSKHGSKRAVAEKLGASVDTVNKYISDLQAETKTYFLKSNGRGTFITPEGKRVLKVAENIVRSLHELDNFGEEASSCKGIVRLGMMDALADYLGSTAKHEICSFLESYPDLHLETIIGNTMPDMSTLEADICIHYEPLENSDVEVVAAKKIRCGLFAAQDYIDKYGMPKDLDDLVKNHRLVMKNVHSLHVPRLNAIINKSRHIVYKTNSVFSLRDALQGGFGIGMSPLWYADSIPNLIRVCPDSFDFDLKLYLMAYKDTKDSPRIKVVLDFLKQIVGRDEPAKNTQVRQG